MTNSLANLVEVMVLDVRMKIAYLKSQSIMTRMVSKLEENGSFLMKSMDIKFYDYSGIESCLRDLQGL